MEGDFDLSGPEKSKFMEGEFKNAPNVCQVKFLEILTHYFSISYKWFFEACS